MLGNVAVDLPQTGTPLRFFDTTAPLPDPLLLLDTASVAGGGLGLEVDAALESNGSKYAYSAHSIGGCKIWRIDDPTDVQLVETIAAATGAWGVTYHRGLLFLSVSYSGVRELQIWLR